MWGGGYNLIIPTDGATIEPDFWFILAQFSPDYIYYYTPSLADIKSINPEQWEKIIQGETKKYLAIMVNKKVSFEYQRQSMSTT